MRVVCLSGSQCEFRDWTVLGNGERKGLGFIDEREADCFVLCGMSFPLTKLAWFFVCRG